MANTLTHDVFGFEKAIRFDVLDTMSFSELKALHHLLGCDKPLPDFYGIKGIKIKHPHNNMESSKLIYKGHEFFADDVVDPMWDEWIHDENYNLIPEREKDEDGFAQYMQEHKDYVFELCENMIGSEV